MERYDDLGKGTQTSLSAPPSANFFPLPVRKYSEVESQISEILMNETTVSLPDKLYLDALNFFHFFSFAEAIITANIALDVFVWGYLLEKYRYEGKSEDESAKIIGNLFDDGLQKAIKKRYFNNFDDKSRDEHPIWKKLVNVRNRRKNVIHPHIKKP